MNEFWTLIEFRGGDTFVDFGYVRKRRAVRSYLTLGAAKAARTVILRNSNRSGSRAYEILHTVIHKDGVVDNDGNVDTRVTSEWVD